MASSAGHNILKFRAPPAQPVDASARDDDGDWQLIERIGRGDAPAFEVFYKRYRRYLERFVYQVTRRQELVDDVINEVMLAVWQQAARTERLALASTWLLGIANFKSLQAMRKLGITRGSDGSMDEGSGDDSLAQRELEQDNLLNVALRHLSPEQRAAMELVYFHGLHYQDIAKVMDCPENTVKTRIFHARKRLREVWPQLSGEQAGTSE
ncbi:MAG: sigma-70 family RNA polymerase sigma factor [Gammaproteobacteria bacterium]|nr:sigma-70 family RNA polymerase sigma factor [Gammaproteobacteria bacterium]